MSLIKFLASLLQLLAFCCRKTMQQGRAYGPSPPPRPTIATTPAPAPAPTKPQVPQYEVDAINTLLALATTSGPNSLGKFSATDCEKHVRFAGVRCNCTGTYCNVIHIDFSNYGLIGQIPGEIGNLSQLVSLDLNSNILDGSLPSTFSKLSQLRSLYLGYNNLDGSLKIISEMRSLRILNLQNNFFDGPIPHEFGSQLPKLQYLSVSDNLLWGEIPVELGNISSLLGLYSDNNRLTGELTPYLGNLSSLQYMFLRNNNFSGPIPSEFGKLGKLLRFNILGNNISGRIPESIGNWQRLLSLGLLGNNFGAPLPKNISALTSLTVIAVDNLPAEIPNGSLFPNVSKAKNLFHLTLRSCSLTGAIPDYIWKDLISLKYVDLSFNNFIGEIPAEIFSEQQIIAPSYIFLRRNNLTGSIPGWMLDSSISLDVSENHFTNKSISGNITEDTNLFECCLNISDETKKWQQVHYYCDSDTPRYDQLYINCGGNETLINGSRYEADVNPNGTSTFFLSRNRAWGYSSMGLYDVAQQYIVSETCNISVEDAPLYTAARVAPISLKYYGFCLKPDNYSVRLHFAEIGWDLNKVRDSGPPLKKRRVFDVEIQDQKVLTDFNIEQEAEGVRKSITKEFYIPVTNSRLEIHLYWSGKGSTFFPTSYYGPLISAISISPVPKKHRKIFSPGIITTISGSGLLLVLMIIGLCWKLGWLGKQRNVVELYPGGDFNFKQIKAATQDFADANKIGKGGFGALYMGTLPKPNGTIQIAVKQLSRKSKQGVREFRNEMETIYALKHPNLVMLMGYCAEEDQLLLVYEYMENNSLEHALFGPHDVKAKLDWKKRVKICLDVAKGLLYLHDECKMKLIHGDIKPSSVYLDKDFNAKISDFGCARPDTTRVKGTQGYRAPECMQTEYSKKADVYSFGILTLAIISGQQSSNPSARGPTEYLLDKAFECLQQKNPSGLIDPSLGPDYDAKEAKTIFYLAMQCINHDPVGRPPMSEVVKVLEGKQTAIENAYIPVPVGDLMKDSAAVPFSQSSYSGSTSVTGASDSTAPLSSNKEIDEPSL